MTPLQGWFGRYRAYVATVVAVLVVVMIAPVGGGGDDGTVAVGGGPAVGGPSGPAGAPLGEVPVDDGAPATGETVSGTTPVTAAARPGGGTARTPARGGGTAATAPGGKPAAAAAPAGGPVQYPGHGTQAALANPNCDPSTGRIRFPSPFAPPCVAPWPAGADNGGTTSPGVDAKTIKFVVYSAASQTSQQQDQSRRSWRDMFDVFNKHYELWGRQVELVFVNASGSDEAAQRADAIKVANMKPFISTTGAAAYLTYSAELAARGILTYEIPVPWKVTQQQAPYRWGAYQDERSLIMDAAEYAGKRLAGRPAKWAGDNAMTVKPRVFGLIYPDVWDKAMWDSEAARNGFAVADAMAYKEDDIAGAQERARVIIARLKSKGVTTLIAGTGFIFTIVVTKEATSQLFFPEWVITGWNNQDATIFSRLNDQQQWAHAFGFGPISVLPPAEKNLISANYRWHHGSLPPTDQVGTISVAHTIAFQSFIGLQGAGPNLTPERFRQAMFSFPASGGVWCGCRSTFGVSFGRHIQSLPWDDYTGWDDVTEKWWDTTYRTKDEVGLDGVGAWMKVDGGRRYLPGQWPRSDPKVFDPDGAIEHVEDYPPNEAPPPYEHKPHN